MSDSTFELKRELMSWTVEHGRTHTAAIISATNPFGNPFSEAEPDLRLMRGVARPITN